MINGKKRDGVPRAVDDHRHADGFVCDNGMSSQIFMAGFPIAGIACPTRYFAAASSIRLAASVRCGLGVIRVSLQRLLRRAGRIRCARYGRKS